MNVAILFNSDDPKYNGIYGDGVRDLILSGLILQESKRHLKISIGDVLIYSHARTDESYKALAEKTYFHDTWSKLNAKKLRATYMKQTVFAWVVQNVTIELSETIDKYLSKDSSYLGIHEVDFSNPIHLALYRNSMIPKYRITGNTCNLFYSMGEEDENSDVGLNEIRNNGFEIVQWEDYGAHQTIFDDFDTQEHFMRVNMVQKALAPFFKENEDEAGELIMLIEDINPKLFDTLAAAIKTLSIAETDEDYAQVGLSARRYFEQLADGLFPPRDTPYNGRKVTKAEYKNRLWAYIGDAIPLTDSMRDEKIQLLGKEIDNLIIEANKTLHHSRNREDLMGVFSRIAKISVALFTLTPDNARNPYYAFNQNIAKFMEEAMLRSGKSQ